MDDFIKTLKTNWGAELQSIEGNSFVRIQYKGDSVVEFDKDGRIYICADAKKVKISPYFSGRVEGIQPKHV